MARYEVELKNGDLKAFDAEDHYESGAFIVFPGGTDKKIVASIAISEILAISRDEAISTQKKQRPVPKMRG